MATITSLSASTVSPGATLTINGTEFGASQGPSTVFLGPVPLTVTSWGDTAISVTIPTDADSGEIYVKLQQELDAGYLIVSNTPPAQC